MRAVLLGLLLALVGLSGPAHAQELFPLQQVQVQQPQASPEIVSVIATPAAFLASSGTVNAQLSTTCLGPCPATPNYVLASNPSGTCSGNNNASFSLTPAGNLTASGLTSTVYACVKVTMPGASNTGKIWLLQVSSVASPSINVVTLRRPYFASGSAFSSPIDLTCQPPSVLGSTADYTLCTGVPGFTLDNTPGDCAQPNNSLFALNGSVLSLPPQASGDFYSCVKVAMAGAPSAAFQLKASVSTSNTGSPAISGVYFNPPFYAANSPYSGKLVTYCVNDTVQTTTGLFATHCPSQPTYTFSTSCGGNNNSDFTLGPDGVITSNGSLGTGDLFPCIVPTIAGVGGSGVAQYANLYAGGPSTLHGISVYPTFFSIAKGSMTGALRPMCDNAECTGSPEYAFSTACPSNDNSLFTLNGSSLGIATKTPGTYNACLSLAMSGATNTGAAFQVPVTATTSTSNCPATPPLQAADVGFTKLLACLDGADPQNAQLFNWANCTRGVVPSNQLWNFDGLGVDCGTSLGDQEVSQVVDPMTGDTVLKIHWDGKADTDLMLGNFFTLHEEARDFPQAMYAEVSLRLAPDHVASYTSQCCAPAFWTFSTQSVYLPAGCVQSDPVNFCYNAIPEVDTEESGNGIGLLDAVHQYGIPATAPSGPPTCCMSGQGFFSSGDFHTLEMWNANNLAGVPFQGYTSFGTRYLTDGVSATQYCYYWDNVLVQSFTGSGTPRFAPACQKVDFTAAGANSLAWQLRGRHQFDLWFAGGWAFNSYVCQQYSGICTGNGQQGPENQDAYLRYIAIWGPANADQYNLGNGFDSQPPHPVSQPWPY